MDIRLVAFDLDGTLLRSDKSISPRTMQALLRAKEKGVLLVPATGRLYRSLPEPLRNPDLMRYLILINGAQVYDSAQNRTLLQEELTPESALQMMRFLKTRNVVRGVYIDGLGHMGVPLMYERACELARDIPNFYLSTAGTYVPVIKMAYETAGPEKILYSSDAPFGDEIQEMAKIRYICKDPAHLELMLGGNAEKLLGL